MPHTYPRALGTPESDIIYGSGGNDIIEGRGGSDWISGGPRGDNEISYGMETTQYSAGQIRWQTSPFQHEVAVANLGFGILCILAFSASYGFRLASVIGISIWLWGDAIVHIRQMIIAKNFSPGNAGPWFWSDVLVPPLLIWLIIRLKDQRSEATASTK